MSRYIFSLILSLILVNNSISAAVVYPTSTPSGETASGTFNQYFTNMFTPTCTGSQTISGFSSVGVPICITGGGNISGPVSRFPVWDTSGNILTGSILAQTYNQNTTTNYMNNNFKYGVGLTYGPDLYKYVMNGGYDVGWGGNMYMGGAGNWSSSGSMNVALGAWSMMRNTSGSSNSVFGWNSLGGNNGSSGPQSGHGNTVMGSESLGWVSTASFNSALGKYVLANLTTGNYNVAIGINTLNSNITGSNNVAIGSMAGSSITSGSSNIAIGYNVQVPSATASNQLNIGNWIYANNGDIGIGVSAPGAKLEVAGQVKITGGAPGAGKVLTSDATGLASWTTPSINVSNGLQILNGQAGLGGYLAYDTNIDINNKKFSIQGINPFIGFKNYLGNDFARIGSNDSDSRFEVATTNAVTAIVFYLNDNGLGGRTEAMRITPAGNVGIGTPSPGAKLEINGQIKITGGSPGAGKVLTSDANGLASWGVVPTQQCPGYGGANTCFGLNAFALNISGAQNTVYGYNALYSQTSASYNTAIGTWSLYSNTSGTNNTAVGWQSLYSNTTGGYNVAIGDKALVSNTTGHNNLADGAGALYLNTTGFFNSASGPYALFNNTNGNNNTAVGFKSLFSNTTGNNNITLGYYAGSDLVSGTNNIIIGSNVQANISNTSSNQLNIGNWIYGNNGNIGIGVASPSYKLHIAGTAGGTSWTNTSDIRLKKNIETLPNASLLTLSLIRPVSFDWKDPKDSYMQARQYGFIAQEVEKIYPNLVSTANDEMKTKSVNYDGFIPVLVASFQELKRQNDALQSENELLKKRLDAIEARLSR